MRLFIRMQDRVLKILCLKNRSMFSPELKREWEEATDMVSGYCSKRAKIPF